MIEPGWRNLAVAHDSKSCGSRPVRVRVPPRAQKNGAYRKNKNGSKAGKKGV